MWRSLFLSNNRFAWELLPAFVTVCNMCGILFKPPRGLPLVWGHKGTHHTDNPSCGQPEGTHPRWIILGAVLK